MRRKSPESSLQAAFTAAMQPLANALVLLRVSANGVTALALLAGMAGGAFLAFGDFGWATSALVLASVGDALDGSVARRTRTASIPGALFDASADRYQEFFVFGGLALFFRGNWAVLALVLLALGGSFMVSYGSAKAEGFGVPVPPGPMRRPERAACLCGGVAAVGLISALDLRSALPAWLTYGPVVAAIAAIAALGNLSAVRRLQIVAAQASRGASRIPGTP